ncbi:MAG: GNAT family N-acetyltransferase, partial [Phycisphaerales bacterium]
DAPRCRVRQVCLAVPGSGRTAMLFLSTPDLAKSLAPFLGPKPTQVAEISASIAAALDGLRDLAPERVTLAQALMEPRHAWARKACSEAGMIFVGQLDYMRKPITMKDLTPGQEPDWPKGVTVRPITTLDPDAPDTDFNSLIDALNGSYEQTLDCPELCGLRSMPDVVESHKSTGDYNPNRWLLIFKDNRPAGCCLLSHCPLSRGAELVYLGLAPTVRGLGLGRRVLEYAIRRMGPVDIREVTCAVDNRNTPAIGIYESLGFTRFDARVGFVAPISARA